LEHKPVLLKEVLNFFDYLQDTSGVVADFTIGGGGHSYAILRCFPKIKVVGFDKDDFAINIANEKLKQFKNRVELFNMDFANFNKVIDFKLNGAIVDLGISSFHIDDLERGFSFESDSMLDMRMDRNNKLTAYKIINEYGEKELSDIFYKFGEIRNNKKVVSAIIKYRKSKKIFSCKELSEIIANNYFTRNRKVHPATKFFQALRIYINRELDSLSEFLSKIFDYLKIGARLQIISFHSLEDRIVKKKFKYEALSCVCPQDLMFCNCNKVARIKILTKKPVIPGKDEILENRRSRSAKLRVAEVINEV